MMFTPEPMYRTGAARIQWLEELVELAQRYSAYNVVADLSSMSLDELWGLYLRLRRLAS